MKRKRNKSKLWSVPRITHPRYDFVLRVTELTRGGNLYVVRMVDGRQRMTVLDPRVTRLDLGSNEKTQRAGACAKAFGVFEQLAEEGDDNEPVDAGTVLTLAALVDQYEQSGLHGVGASYRRGQLAKLRRISVFLGPERLVGSLCRSDIEAFAAARLLHVGRNTVAGDLLALKIALNFATEYRRKDGQVLLDKNPLAKVRVPRDTPRRPWATAERYEALQAVADQLPDAFGVVLSVAWQTGHRLGAILALKWRDIQFATSKACPFGNIRFYADVRTSKKATDHVVPLNVLAATALARWREQYPGIAAGPVFPSERNPAQPVPRYVAHHWLKRAERLAGLEHETQGGWHAFRRGWATARKHLPLVDVAAGGGWKDTATVLQCYQHADPRGTLAAIINTA